MFEYRITVSLNGRFLFRTEWDDNFERATNTATIIKSSMPLTKVTVARRNATMLAAIVKDDLSFKF